MRSGRLFGPGQVLRVADYWGPPSPSSPAVHTRKPERPCLDKSTTKLLPGSHVLQGEVLETRRGITIVSVLPKCGQVEQLFGWTLMLCADKAVGLSSSFLLTCGCFHLLQSTSHPLKGDSLKSVFSIFRSAKKQSMFPVFWFFFSIFLFWVRIKLSKEVKCHQI